VLALSTDLRFGVLGRRFLPDTPLFSWCGIFILAVSASYAIWARWHLGKNWSGNLVIRPDHRLIRTGPYAFSRHPIYTGIIGGMFGTMLVVGEWRGLLALVLIVVHYRIKVSREEKWLLQHLGAEYSQYCREVRAIVPFIL
jgi:protein-S-isoprenylcysteine O-methyltransferase Ste14